MLQQGITKSFFIFSPNYFIMIFILFSLLLIINSQCCSVNLRYHRWCPNSAISHQIFQKLSKDPFFKKIKFNNYDQTSINPFSFEVYPTIWFQKDSKQKFIYENQHSLIQLKYWITIYCLNYVPVCNQSLLKRALPIINANFSILDSKHRIKITQMAIQSPQIRFCEYNINLTFQEIEHLYSSYNLFPFLFNEFNHNIRNHLIKSAKVGIFLIAKNESLISNQFDKHFSRIIQLSQGNTTKNQSKGIWKLPKEDYTQLLFIKADPSTKICKKLLEFINLQENYQNMVVSIRFLQGNLYFKVYPETMFDNRFTFWAHEQVTLGVKTPQKNQQYCIVDQIVYRYNPYSLDDVLKKVELQKMIENSSFQCSLKLVPRKFQKKQEKTEITLCRMNNAPVKITQLSLLQNLLAKQNLAYQQL